MSATIKELMVMDDNDVDLPLKALVNTQNQASYLDHTDGPTTMLYDNELGWINEPIGPKPKYWKRIKRKNEKENNSPIQATTTANSNRVGPTPLQELDQSSTPLKQSKDKKRVADQ